MKTLKAFWLLPLAIAAGCGSGNVQGGPSADAGQQPPPPVNRPPTAAAGADQQVLVGDTVALDGRGSADPESKPLTYAWSLTGRPQGSSAALSSATAAAPTFVADLAGTYSLQLIVNDGELASSPDAVQVTASTPDLERPVANAGPDQAAMVGALVHLDGSASADPNGSPLTFAWTLQGKPAGSNVTLSIPASAMAGRFVPDAAGDYVVQLVVNDGAQDSLPDTARISVAAAPANRPPSAYAGADKAATVGSRVSLDGSGSRDPEQDALTYAWTFASRPPGSSATFDAPSAAATGFTADVAGLYVAQLVVNDGRAASKPDAALITASASNPPASTPSTPAVIRITDQVVQSAVEPIGANLGRIMGGTNFAINNHVSGSGFEPAMIRKLQRVYRTGVDAGGAWLEWDSEGGVHMWETNATGFGNGADVRVYRLVNPNGQPLAYAGDFTDNDGADHVVFLGAAKIPMPGGALPNGGWIAEGPDGQNRVYLDRNLGLARGDYVFVTLRRQYVPVEHLDPRLHGYYSGDQPYLNYSNDATVGRLVPHPTPIPAAFEEPGETCLRVTAAAGAQTIGEYVYHAYDDGEGQWYSQLTPGASYRVSVWLRQEGLANGGKVRFVFAGDPAYRSADQATPWTVTGEWAQYTYDFVGPAYPTGAWHIANALELTGPGTLYVDNFLLYRNDAKHEFKPFGPHEISFDEMMRSMPSTGLKPAVRFYSLNYGNASIESLLGNYGDAGYNIETGALERFGGATILQSLEWAMKTGASPAERVVPYFTLSEEFTEHEWRAVVEYLGVPYDPANDTPRSKPYAWRRYQQRGGVATPWTDEFREILIEYGNETWHNGAGGYGWHGFSQYGAVHQGGREYGLFARYMFQENVMRLPEWSAHNLGAKLKFVAGANYDPNPDWAYGELAVQAGTHTNLLGHANYVGPKWETGDTGSSVFDDHGMQETLVGMHTGMRELIEGAAASRDLLNGTRGTDYQLMAYEGGPSGYWTNRDNPIIDELYGKSLGMGVAALDAWLFSSLNGYGHQCYLGYGSGNWWSSHTPPLTGGFREHAGWIAMRMRNAYANGREMLGVLYEQRPGYPRGSETVPLMTAYALRDGARATFVLLLSRKLDGNHDGQSFGDGYTPVTLRLPFAQAPRSIQLHKIAHLDGTPANPRENNRESEVLGIVSQTIDVAQFAQDFVVDADTGGGAGGMPPGTVYLYVFEH